MKSVSGQSGQFSSTFKRSKTIAHDKNDNSQVNHTESSDMVEKKSTDRLEEEQTYNSDKSLKPVQDQKKSPRRN